MSHKYDDLISQPHHTSSKRPRMPTHDRAAQFAPFAALTGYQEVIGETSRLTTEKVELGDDMKEELNQKLQQLSDILDQQPAVILTYFQPDGRKEGGTYWTVTGAVRAIRLNPDRLIMLDGTEILFSCIRTLNILKP